jgi:hypothetical protein
MPFVILDKALSSAPSQLPLERLIKNRRQQGVKLGGGLGLHALKRVYLRLQGIQVGDDAALLMRWGNRHWKLPDLPENDVRDHVASGLVYHTVFYPSRVQQMAKISAVKLLTQRLDQCNADEDAEFTI